MTENKYHKGKIYTIRSNQTNLYYIGSTTQDLYKRLYEHKKDYKLFNNEKKNYITSYEIVKYDDVYIELLEIFKCENKNELNKREGELIRQYKDNVVNKYIPNRTSKEYYQDNQDKISAKDKLNKEYRNKVKREWHDKKYKCDKCNIEICNGNKYKHNKTQSHLNNCKDMSC